MDEKALDVETWLPISGYEGLYEVSDLGRIAYLPKGRGTNNKCLIPRGIKSLSDNGIGYLTVSLCMESVKRRFYLHILVAIHFVPNPENKPEVNHDNGNKYDCRAINLTWATRLENEQHAYATGLKFSGPKNAKNKAVRQYDLNGHYISTYPSASSVSSNFDRSVIQRCARGKLKHAYGFKWDFVE